MSKGIYVGSDKVSKLYWGGDEVKKIYKGSELVYESTPAVMPAQRDTISVNTGSTYGTKNFRVIEINNTIALVSMVISPNEIKSKYDNSAVTNYYFGSTIDVYLQSILNTNFSETFKKACTDMNFIQYQMSSSTSASSSKYTWINDNNYVTYLTVNSTKNTHSEARKIRLLSYGDIITYLNAQTNMSSTDTPLNYGNVITMVTGTQTGQSGAWWMLDAHSTKTYAWYINWANGSNSNTTINNATHGAIPVFALDLSKISFTIVTPSNT